LPRDGRVRRHCGQGFHQLLDGYKIPRLRSQLDIEAPALREGLAERRADSDVVVPRVFVLLATCNGSAYLEDQIVSLAAQTGVAVRVLLSDDGSVDDSVACAQRAASLCNLDVLPVVNSEKLGGAAKNFYHLLRIADLADTDFVALCDQDDIWLPDKLRCATETLRDTGADFYSCNSIAFWPDNREVRIRKDFPFRQWDYLFESASHGCTYVMTAKSARSLQKFLHERKAAVDAIEFHDWLIYAWARFHSKKWVCDARFLIRYRQTSKNALGANVGWKAALRRVRQLRTGWYREQTLLIASAIEANEEPIVKRLTRNAWCDRIYMALSAGKCRRSVRDRIAFAIATLFF